MVVEDYQKEEFKNKMSAICFSAKSNPDFQIEGELGEFVAAYNQSNDPKTKMEELLEIFWNRSREERQAFIDNMFAVEEGLTANQNLNIGEEGFNFFDD